MLHLYMINANPPVEATRAIANLHEKPRFNPGFFRSPRISSLSVFFFPVKKKSARESYFWAFFGFFHGHFSVFTPTFWPIFQFFHAHFFFHLCRFSFFLRAENLVSRVKKKIKITFCFHFQGKNCSHF